MPCHFINLLPVLYMHIPAYIYLLTSTDERRMPRACKVVTYSGHEYSCLRCKTNIKQTNVKYNGGIEPTIHFIQHKIKL